MRSNTRRSLALWGAMAALTAALAARPALAADVVVSPSWLVKPSAAELQRVWPTDPKARAVDGAAKLECVVNVDGSLSPCKILSEEPAGLGFGNAALEAAKSFAMKPMTRNGVPVGGAVVVIPLRFNAGHLPPGAVITNPDWLRKPSDDDLTRLWPAEATRLGVSGKASIQCVVTADGLLDGCVVISETPTGAGFGGAALLLSKSFAMKPMLVNGAPVGGASIVIPLNFSNPYPADSPGNTIKILSNAAWAQAPTRAQVARAFPADQLQKAGFGYAVIRCKVWVDGQLGHCDTQSERPATGAFASAALQLTGDFKVDVSTYAKGFLNETYVDVPIAFHPTSATAATVNPPEWRKGPDPAALAAAFPAKALAAGVAHGRVRLDCIANQLGHLTRCSVAAESPPGLGFGDAAVKASQALAVSAWSDRGDPVDGEPISVPIAFDAPAAHAP